MLTHFRLCTNSACEALNGPRHYLNGIPYMLAMSGFGKVENFVESMLAYQPQFFIFANWNLSIVVKPSIGATVLIDETPCLIVDLRVERQIAALNELSGIEFQPQIRISDRTDS